MARVEIDCAERPAGRFVHFRARDNWRYGPRALGLARVGAGRLCQTETAGGGLGIIASHRISSATRWEAVAAKRRHGGPFVRAGRDP